MQNYKKVPDIITGKDLDYLADMFNWFSSSYKNTEESTNLVNDNQIKTILKECATSFYDYLNTILDILEKGGETNEQ